MHRRLHYSSWLGRITGRDAPRAPLELLEPVLIRYSGDGDRAGLERLAALGSRTLTARSFLVAEGGGKIVAPPQCRRSGRGARPA
jgi:hypothetical protein